MCGIFFCLFEEGECCQKLKVKAIEDYVIPLVARRGPDCLQTEEKLIFNQNTRKHFRLNLTGSVLHLRGDLTSQPLHDISGNTFLWNGEVFGGIQVPDDCNDTLILFNLLGNCSDVNSVMSLLSSIQGPWAFVYYQAVQEKLWFGRDFFGRRSMVWHLPTDEEDVFSVSSVAQRNGLENDELKWDWEEIPADGIYCLEFSPTKDNLNHVVQSLSFHSCLLKKYHWPSLETRTAGNHSCGLTQPVLPFNKQLPLEQDLELMDEHYSNIGLSMTNGFKDINNPACVTNDSLSRTSDSQNITEFINIDKIQMGSNEVQSSTRINEKKITETCRNFFFNAECNDLENLTRTLDLQKPCTVKLDDGKELCSSIVNSSTRIDKQITVEESNDLLYNGKYKDFNKLLLPSMGNDENLRTNSESQNKMENGNKKVGVEGVELSKQRAVLVNNAESLITMATSITHNMSSWRDKLASHHVTSTKHHENLPYVLIDVLGEAVRKRVFNLPRLDKGQDFGMKTPCKAKLQNLKLQDGKQLKEYMYNGLKYARVGILFSGGIDSIVLAALADRYVPENESIDLMNVAFEQKKPKPNPTNKKKIKPSNTGEKSPSFDVPDRLTGISGLKELARINPQRQWNFIEVNVTLSDLQKERCEHITHLVSPLTSVLDDSIGCALWFAARGSGTLKCAACINGSDSPCMHPQCYTSEAKVLLVGMGADEQLGGYARHRTKFNQEGWLGLVNEMEMEVNRISQRNLGRDDRCISDHGREARFPFLDEQVVSLLSGIPVWLKTDPRLPRGTGEKILLRKSARLLGLTSSAVLPKRAIQFGSRIAKLEGKNEKGSDTCRRLKS